MILAGSQSWWQLAAGGGGLSFEVVLLLSRKRERTAPCSLLQAVGTVDPDATSSTDQRETCRRFLNLVSSKRL